MQLPSNAVDDIAVNLINATPQLDVDKYINNTYLTNHRIWILQTWIGNIVEFEKALRCAAERKLEIRIAILNPKSDHLRHRADNLKVSVEEVNRKIWQTLNNLEVLARENNFHDDFEIKVYDSAPAFGMYLLDNILNAGFYWHGLNSTKGPNIVMNVTQEVVFSNELMNHFEFIWASGDTINFRDRNWRNQFQ